MKPSPSVYKSSSSPTVSSEGELAFGQTSALPLWMLASEIKQTILSTNLACLLAFELASSQTPHMSLGNKITVPPAPTRKKLLGLDILSGKASALLFQA